MWWPKLDEEVTGELEADHEVDGEVRRSERDLLEEVLALTRRFASDRERRPESDHPVWEDLFRRVVELARAMRSGVPDDEMVNALTRLLAPVEYISAREMRGGGRSRGARRAMVELQDIISSCTQAKSTSEPPRDETGS